MLVTLRQNPRNLARDFTHYHSEPNKNQHLMNKNGVRKASSKQSAGLRAKKNRLGWIVALTLGLWAALGQAQELRYHYVALDDVSLPEGFAFFFPEAMNNSSRVCGEAYDGEFFAPHVAVYHRRSCIHR